MLKFMAEIGRYFLGLIIRKLMKNTRWIENHFWSYSIYSYEIWRGIWSEQTKLVKENRLALNIHSKLWNIIGNVH